MLVRERQWGIVCAVALVGCAGGQDGTTTIGMTSLPAGMTAAMDTDDTDDDDDDVNDGFDDRGDDDDDDDDDRGDDDDDDDDDDDEGTTGGDEGTGAGDDDDDGPTSSLMLHFNTEGAFLTFGEDNAPLWQSTIISGDEDVPAYGDSTRAGQIQSAFESIVADYPYEIVTEDPGIDSEYTMILLMDVAPSTFGFPFGTLSIGVSDCGNENLNNVLLVFDEESQDNPVDRVANSIAYALGVASGLNTNAEDGDVMNTAAADSPASFTDQCVSITDDTCPVLPAGLCGANEQNSHEALEASFP